MLHDIIESMQRAKVEADKQKIRANAVIISPEFAYFGGDFELPDMILGMKCMISRELPDEYAFAIVDSPPPVTNKDKIKAEYLKELSELSLDDLVKKVYGISLKERENNDKTDH